MDNISDNNFAFYIYLLAMDNREIFLAMEEMRRRMDAQEEEMRRGRDAQDEVTGRLRGRIFHLEEEVRVTREEVLVTREQVLATIEELRVSRMREVEVNRRLQETERRPDESWRWESSYQIRGERAENAARIWEARVRSLTRWEAEASRIREQEWVAEVDRMAAAYRADIEERERFWSSMERAWRE